MLDKFAGSQSIGVFNLLPDMADGREPKANQFWSASGGFGPRLPARNDPVRFKA